MWWVPKALIVHLLLLGSIFVIYFRSPVITGLRPQQTLTGAPAQRVVLIVTDGLRSESFFRRNCSDVPHIRDLMLKKGGLVGISHTHVPTESRPGHIALIAGLYEDPSAVTRGWKENPINFDTLFNRSHQTYAWGANDVLHIFSDVSGRGGGDLFIDAYDHDLDFSGRNKTYELDEWVFDRVRLLLRRKSEELRSQQQVVFFLHLLGLDTAGHVHKPGTPLFLENLHRTDKGIRRIYENFEQTFPDGLTAYVLTSDHGMTNAGSHGAGDPLETDTPFYLWGAGIAAQAPRGNSEKTFQAGDNTRLPLHELEQAQLAPLMSALIGLPPPMNNFGTLPRGYLNVTPEYEARALHSNALQLLEQYRTLRREHKRGFFSASLRQFEKLNAARIANYEYRTEHRFRSGGDYDNSADSSYTIMRDALDGIDYYHNYYRNALLLSTTATFIGWICYLLQLLPDVAGLFSKKAPRRRVSLSLFAAGLLLAAFLLLQHVTFVVAFYLTLPIAIWMLVVMQKPPPSVQHSMRLWRSTGMGVVRVKPLQWLLLILCAELLVFTFFERKLISLGFLLFSVINGTFRAAPKSRRFYLWTLLVLVLATFPLLPPSVGYADVRWLALGISLIFVRAAYYVRLHFGWRTLVICGFAVANSLFCSYQHSLQRGVSLLSQAISWSFLVYALLAIVFFNRDDRMKQRIERIFLLLSSLYALLSTSYELLFVVLLASELLLNYGLKESTDGDNGINETAPLELQKCFRLAFTILLYTFFSFFGSGNVASVSSFDPNIVRCFLSTFSPFTIMALVILKLVIPVVLNIAIIFGSSSLTRIAEPQIYICMLLICDVMGLNFLFLVRNRGSWLEIGSSISHFVIMEVTTVVLLLLTCLAKLFLKINTSSGAVINLKKR